MVKKNLENTSEGLILRVRIVPNSAKNDFVFEEEFLKIKITAAAVENKANKALIAFLAKKIHCAKSNIKIIKGELSREKTLLIANLSEEEFLSCVNSG